MKKPELLAPAGNFECLKSAINAGSDAVYLGGIYFGARSYAGNFNDEEMIEAIKYAHIYGVKVYVTVNTIVYENEVDKFLNYIDFLHKNNVDAIIIQDLGMMNLVRKTYPNLEIHASTQMNIHNLEGVKLLEELGIKRIVLAREVDLNKIKEIKKKSKVEIETFIEGALCFSYSGECLMSSLIGGRSGNRGTCTQCCRMKYDIYSDNKKINKDEYLLSMKDLNVLKNLDKLIESGIDSFKIEGRMKRKEYVYLMTSIYRKAIDNYFLNKPFYNEEDILEMKKIFNREFTKGYILNEENSNLVNPKRPNHMGIKIGEVIGKNKIKLTSPLIQGDGIRIVGKKDIGEIVNKIYLDKKLVNKAEKNDIVSLVLKEDIFDGIVLKTSDKLQIEEIDKKIEIKKRIPINMHIEIKDKNLIISLDDYKNKVMLKEEIVEKALNNGTDNNRIISQLSKLNDTPYILNNISINNNEKVFIKISDLNDIRNKAILELTNKRLYEIPYKKEIYNINVPSFEKTNKKSYLINNYEDYLKIKDENIEHIYIEEPLYNEINDDRKVLKLPRVNFTLNNYNNLVLIGDLGSLYKYKNKITDFGFNVTNSYTVAFLHNLGVNKVTLSYELNKSQIKELIREYKKRYHTYPNLELITSSTPETMISKFNMFKYYNIDNGYLKDKFNNKFELKYKDDILTIYNYKKIEIDDCYDIGVNSSRIHL